MKVGTENRNKLIAACVLMGIAAVLVLRMFFSGPSPVPAAASSPTPTAAAPRPTRPASRSRASSRTTTHKGTASAPHSIDPSLRYDWLDLSEKTKYRGNGRNIFLAQAELPKPIAPAVVKHEPPPVPQGPPPPPPINLKFYGFASGPGE
ncbi:MAG: hypothetical protein JOZ80_10985, partial [Acidobacteriaceae bacterium]|nr:hypothetical protein [Acidobacteriaceae bacterium]